MRIYFFEKTSGTFRFVWLYRFVDFIPLEILEKTSFYPWKFCRFVWHLLEIPRLKTKTHGNFTSHDWKFITSSLHHLWKSTSFLVDPLEFPHALSAISLDILRPQLVKRVQSEPEGKETGISFDKLLKMESNF